MQDRQTGVVSSFSDPKGFGYIETSNQHIFVHYTAIQGDGYRALSEGERVSFEVIDGPKGPIATQVRRVA